MTLNTLSLVHDVLRREVRPGGLYIDATAGRGRDTALLCRLAGPAGRVLAFDIQAEAVDSTRALLAAEGLANARVYLDSHANLARYAPAESVDAVVFNFGRLPGGDSAIMTRPESSLAAIDAALALLRPGGLVAIALYYGKANGYDERDAILSHVAALDPKRYSVLQCHWANRPNDPPMALFLWKD